MKKIFLTLLAALALFSVFATPSITPPHYSVVQSGSTLTYGVHNALVCDAIVPSRAAINTAFTDIKGNPIQTDRYYAITAERITDESGYHVYHLNSLYTNNYYYMSSDKTNSTLCLKPLTYAWQFEVSDAANNKFLIKNVSTQKYVQQKMNNDAIGGGNIRPDATQENATPYTYESVGDNKFGLKSVLGTNNSRYLSVKDASTGYFGITATGPSDESGSRLFFTPFTEIVVHHYGKIVPFLVNDTECTAATYVVCDDGFTSLSVPSVDENTIYVFNGEEYESLDAVVEYLKENMPAQAIISLQDSKIVQLTDDNISHSLTDGEIIAFYAPQSTSINNAPWFVPAGSPTSEFCYDNCLQLVATGTADRYYLQQFSTGKYISSSNASNHVTLTDNINEAGEFSLEFALPNNNADISPYWRGIKLFEIHNTSATSGNLYIIPSGNTEAAPYGSGNRRQWSMWAAFNVTAMLPDIVALGGIEFFGEADADAHTATLSENYRTVLTEGSQITLTHNATVKGVNYTVSDLTALYNILSAVTTPTNVTLGDDVQLSEVPAAVLNNANITLLTTVELSETAVAPHENYACKFSTVTLNRKPSTTNWTPIVLPFEISGDEISDNFAKVYEFGKVTTDDDGDAILSFAPLAAGAVMEAGKPYFVLGTESAASDGLTFENKTLNTSAKTLTLTDDDESWSVRVVGFYNQQQIEGNNIFYFADNQLYYAQREVTIKGFRAYIEVTSSEPDAPVRSFALQWSDDNLATDVDSISVTLTPAEMYNLQGQRVTRASGIVIVDGKKVVVTQ